MIGDVTEGGLWITDGTPDETAPLRDQLGHVIDGYVSIRSSTGDGRVLFTREGPDSSHAVWITDGTPGGTRLVKDLQPSEFLHYAFAPVTRGNQQPPNFRILHGRLARKSRRASPPCFAQLARSVRRGVAGTARARQSRPVPLQGERSESALPQRSDPLAATRVAAGN
jgi:ELWxxDGT repeat protein